MGEQSRPETTPSAEREARVDLPLEHRIWDRFFMVAPLVLVGTVEPDGADDIAPKHMAMPLGWGHRFSFVCTPRHATYSNVERTREFTVSFPTPSQLMSSSLAAAPRDQEDRKPSIPALRLRRAEAVEGALLEGAYLCLECRLDRVVDGFDDEALLIGDIVAASVSEEYLRASGVDDADLVHRSPLLAYVSPGRVAEISTTHSFPFPAGFKR